jgi:hypothetical protein
LCPTVLFSAIVIQWITSNDNAGTAHGSASRGGRTANDTFDSRNGPFSPQTVSGDKGRVDDIAEISLSTIRSDRDRDRTGSTSASEDDIIKETGSTCNLATKIPGPGAVIVTTTIKRESKPSCSAFDDDSEGCTADGKRTHASNRPISVTIEGRPEGFMRQSARTKISAGTHE